MSSSYVEYEKHDHVVVIRMNRPDRLNAMGRDLLAGLAEGFINFGNDPEAHVAVLTGTGRAFCAGLDLKEWVEQGVTGFRLPDLPQVNPFFPRRSPEFSKPVIAAVNGLAYGGGFYLAVNADLVVATESAEFQVSEVLRGQLNGWDLQIRQGFPTHMTMALALGETMGARRGYELGFINELAPPEKLMEQAMAMANRIASLPALVRQYNHELVANVQPVVSVAAVERAVDLRRQSETSGDLEGAVRKFLKKSQPGSVKE